MCARYSIVFLLETLKYFFLVFSAYSYTCILNFETHPVAVAGVIFEFTSDFYFSFGSKFYGIADKVA